MLIVISPAKTLDFDSPATIDLHTLPQFTNESKKLIKALRQLAPQDISELMHISDKLGTLNYDRFQAWQPTFAPPTAKQAILAFKGDVYTGLEAENFKLNDHKYAQKHLRILSGLYGILRPLDLMRPYRLEMGTRFETEQGKDLYAFWGEKLTQQLNDDMASVKSKLLVNLASIEYFKAVQPSAINGGVISPIFKDWKNGQYKIISFFAKKARGLMSAYLITNRISHSDDLLAFDWAGYSYDATQSTETSPVFIRKEAG